MAVAPTFHFRVESVKTDLKVNYYKNTSVHICTVGIIISGVVLALHYASRT